MSALFVFGAALNGKGCRMKPDLPLKEDIALILRAKSGDDSAKASLLHLYRPLIDSLSYQFSATLPKEEQKDFAQEATIAFFHALEQFDHEKGIAFGYFAKVCISNRLIGYLRKRTASLTGNAVPIEEVVFPADDDPAKHLRDYESYLALCDRIRKVLSDFENRIWTLHMSGLTALEIAQATGSDKKSIENALARARRKLRKSLPPC